MSKKHYQWIAEIMALSKDYALGCEQAENLRVSIAKSLAARCKQDNPHFDRSRFLKACKVEE